MWLAIGFTTFDVQSLSEAQSIYCAKRDQSGRGASDWPDGEIHGAEKPYRISYNGRVWDQPWHSGLSPVLDLPR